MGAHERGPSRIDGAETEAPSLLDWVRRDPEAVLGADVRARFDGRFPFLLKLLAAEQPLSLQAHPSAAQARDGFAAENAAGVPLSAPHRNYKDPWSKPELIVALERFEALCGFADPSDAVDVLRSLGVDALRPLTERLQSDGVAEAFGWLIALPPDVGAPLVEATAVACERRADEQPGFSWAARLAEAYPGDTGVVASLLLRYVALEPGEALYLPAGNLHAYLRGVGIELMANSDNVLRAGLTPKHVDVSELLRVLAFDDVPTPLRPRPLGGGVLSYDTPTPSFALSRIDVDAPVVLDAPGPQILLCLDGAVRARSGDAAVALGPGDSALSRACDGPATLTGRGTVYRATVGTTPGPASRSPA